MSSRIATTDAVANSSRVSAPWNTAPRSAWIAAGPVTWAVTPAGASALTVARSCLTAAATSALPVTSRATTRIAAVPS